MAKKSTYNGWNLNFKTPEEYEKYVDYIIEQNPDKHFSKSTAAILAWKMWATIEDSANWGTPVSVLDIDWNDEWSKKFSEPAEEEKSTERKKNPWEKWYSPVDTENYSSEDLKKNSDLYDSIILSNELTKEEKIKKIKQMMAKNSEAAQKFLDKWDTESIKNIWEERKKLKSWTSWWSNDNAVMNYMWDMNANKKTSALDKNNEIFKNTGLSDKQKRWQLSAIMQECSQDSKLMRNRANWVDKNPDFKKYTPEQKAQIKKTLEESAAYYDEIWQDASKKMKALWEPSGWELLFW